MADIYEKLQKIRDALSKEVKEEKFKSFEVLRSRVDRKTKYHKVLPLYSFYDHVATLKLVDLDDIKSTIEFSVPVDLIGVRNAKQYLYQMAFHADIEKSTLTVKEYMTLFKEMETHNVTEKEILERYEIDSMANMTQEIYRRCMSVFKQMTK